MSAARLLHLLLFTCVCSLFGCPSGTTAYTVKTGFAEFSVEHTSVDAREAEAKLLFAAARCEGNLTDAEVRALVGEARWSEIAAARSAKD